MRLFATITFILALNCALTAQDQHFTQFYSAPLTLNPALTGAFDGKFRVSTVYRDQWRQVLESPYTSFATAIDLKYPVRIRGRQMKDAFAFGVVFYNDKIGALDYTNNQLQVSGAFHKALDFSSSQFLSIGMQGGIAQRNIGFGDLRFEDQFNGLDNYSNPTAESLPPNNYTYGDLSVGINYSYAPKHRTALFIGAAMHHFLSPNITFFKSLDELPNGSIPEEIPLFTKYSIQISSRFPLGERFDILPRAYAALQGPHAQLTAGATLRMVISDYSGTALHIGTGARPVVDEETGFNVDAIYGSIGLEYANVLFGFSYDANLNDLSSSRTGQGAFEISIAYLGEYENEVILCPKF